MIASASLYRCPSLVTCSRSCPPKVGGGVHLRAVKLTKVAGTERLPCVPPENRHASCDEE